MFYFTSLSIISCPYVFIDLQSVTVIMCHGIHYFLPSIIYTSLRSRLFHHSVSDLWVRQDRNQSLRLPTDRTHNFKQVPLCCFHSKERKQELGCFFPTAPSHTGEGVSQGPVKIAWNFLLFRMWLCFFGYSLGCYRSLTTFQSSYKVWSICSCLMFLCGNRTWSFLIHHLDDITQDSLFVIEFQQFYYNIVCCLTVWDFWMSRLIYVILFAKI